MAFDTMRIRASAAMAAVLVCAAISDSAQAAEPGTDPRIERLEQSIRDLERRVASLEAQLGERPSASQVAPAKANWRKLKNGMTESDVERLLGSPERVDANPVFITWWYPLLATFSSMAVRIPSRNGPNQPPNPPTPNR
jgi:hypothetical protein